MARNEIRFGPESLFDWPGPESNMGRISLPFQLHQEAATRGDGDGTAARHVRRRLLAGNASASSSLPFSFSSARVLKR